MSQTKVQLIKDAATSEDSIVHDGDTNTKIRFPAADTITAETAGSERLRVDSSGNIGIGKTPSRTLDVSGKIRSSDAVCFGDNSSTPSEGVAIHRPAASTLAVVTNDTERLRIDANGRIQKGSDPTNLGTAALNIVDGNGHSINLSRNQGAGANDDQRLGAIAFHAGLGAQSTVTGGAVIEAFADENQSGSTSATRLAFATKPTGVSPGSAPTERFRINSDGVVQIVSNLMTMGTSTISGGATAGNFTIEFSSATSNAIKLRDTHNAGSTNYIMLVGGSSIVGSVTGTTGQAFFNNLSDYRSKENDVRITDGIEKIKLLRPIRFNYKVDKDTICDGFFAHEVTPAVPTAVTGEKDAVDSEGKFSPQMLDTGKIIPLLTAALQEEIAKREALETRVAALEAA